ncbi:MAG: DUF4330 family protein [Clostridiaceae bacterium]|nr:DUF4330 family protein [Clostridiaceae bacterium]
MKNIKIFKKLNIIDLIAIIAVIIMATGVYVRFFGSPTKTVVQNTEFHYTFEVKNIREENLKGLKKSLNGNFYLNEKITGEMGSLIKIESRPATQALETADGNIVMAEIPERFDADLTFKITGKVNDRGYFTPTLQHISAGVEYKLKCKWSAIYGSVTNVWE